MTERLQRELSALPVAAVAAELNETLRTGTTAIVTAAPGAGKSTVLPLTILEGLQVCSPGACEQGVSIPCVPQLQSSEVLLYPLYLCKVSRF